MQKLYDKSKKNSLVLIVMYFAINIWRMSRAVYGIKINKNSKRFSPSLDSLSICLVKSMTQIAFFRSNDLSIRSATSSGKRSNLSYSKNFVKK